MLNQLNINRIQLTRNVVSPQNDPIFMFPEGHDVLRTFIGIDD